MSNPGGYGKRGWNDGGGGPGKRRRPAEAEDGEIEEGEMQEMPHGRGGRGVCPPLTLRCAAAPHPRVAALDFFAPVASILAHLILSLFSARSQAHHPEAARRRLAAAIAMATPAIRTAARREARQTLAASRQCAASICRASRRYRASRCAAALQEAADRVHQADSLLKARQGLPATKAVEEGPLTTTAAIAARRLDVVLAARCRVRCRVSRRPVREAGRRHHRRRHAAAAKEAKEAAAVEAGVALLHLLLVAAAHRRHHHLAGSNPGMIGHHRIAAQGAQALHQGICEEEEEVEEETIATGRPDATGRH